MLIYSLQNNDLQHLRSVQTVALNHHRPSIRACLMFPADAVLAGAGHLPEASDTHPPVVHVQPQQPPERHFALDHALSHHLGQVVKLDGQDGVRDCVALRRVEVDAAVVALVGAKVGLQHLHVQATVSLLEDRCGLL